MKTVTTWKTKQEFVSKDNFGENEQENNTIQLDGTRENGFSPKAVLLSAVAACSGIDVVEILEKMRIPFSGFYMETTATQTEEIPKVFSRVLITYHLKTAKENEDKVRKAIELSLGKYCSVSAMLKKNSPVDYELVIE